MTTATMRMLVSVRDVQEALAAADGGADFIDLKEPREGALGGLPLNTIREVVCALRHAFGVPFETEQPDLRDAGGAVGAEDEAEQESQFVDQLEAALSSEMPKTSTGDILLEDMKAVTEALKPSDEVIKIVEALHKKLATTV